MEKTGEGEKSGALSLLSPLSAPPPFKSCPSATTPQEETARLSISPTTPSKRTCLSNRDSTRTVPSLHPAAPTPHASITPLAKAAAADAASNPSFTASLSTSATATWKPGVERVPAPQDADPKGDRAEAMSRSTPSTASAPAGDKTPSGSHIHDPCGRVGVGAGRPHDTGSSTGLGNALGVHPPLGGAARSRSGSDPKGKTTPTAAGACTPGGASPAVVVVMKKVPSRRRRRRRIGRRRPPWWGARCRRSSTRAGRAWCSGGGGIMPIGAGNGRSEGLGGEAPPSPSPTISFLARDAPSTHILSNVSPHLTHARRHRPRQWRAGRHEGRRPPVRRPDRTLFRLAARPPGLRAAQARRPAR